MSDQKVVNAVAGEALTSAQFKVVYVDGSDSEKVKLVGTAGGVSTILGVLENAPADDGLAYVVTEGYCSAIAGGTLEPFDELTTTNAGLVQVATSSGHYVIGRYEPFVESGSAAPDAASGDRVRVFLYSNKRYVIPA